MIPELLKLGNDFYQFLDALPEKVLVVISSDLAHTHLASGPYGYSNASEPFDKAVGEWGKTLDGKFLLQDAAKYADEAKSCGYTGLVMLHGLLTATRASQWEPRMLANFHPTYYGMMVATFLKKK